MGPGNYRVFVITSFCILYGMRNKVVIQTCNEDQSTHLPCEPGSSVGRATNYGLEDGATGIESPWGRDFSHTSRPALGPTQPPVQ
jgi:hypothetical protein